MEFAVALLVVAMIVREYFFQKEREQTAAERAELLQRIQAPEIAVVSHATEEPARRDVGMPLMSDEDYNNLLNS